LRAPAVRAGLPGRLRVVESGLEGQVALAAVPPCVVGSGAHAAGPAPVLVLPDMVDADEFDARLNSTCARRAPDGRPIELPIGLAADDLEPALLRVPAGDHVFIGGAARTGRSTALHQVEVAWRRLHAGGTVVRVDRRDPALDADVGPIDGQRPVLVVVDDAERVDDPDGSLGRLLGRPGVTFAVAARLEAVRVAYGHWTREVARSRCGLIMTSVGDVDGELLGATLPRRPMIPARPGLAWVIDHRGHRLVQVAARMPP
jgi:S-DNA-T family DNA segregation ATPase FtsK/SpoIIIE